MKNRERREMRELGFGGCVCEKSKEQRELGFERYRTRTIREDVRD